MWQNFRNFHIQIKHMIFILIVSFVLEPLSLHLEAEEPDEDVRIHEDLPVGPDGFEDVQIREDGFTQISDISETYETIDENSNKRKRLESVYLFTAKFESEELAKLYLFKSDNLWKFERSRDTNEGTKAISVNYNL